MADKTVTITRAGSTLNVDNPSKHVDPSQNDRLSFTCADDFAVFFKNNRNPHDADIPVVEAARAESAKLH